MDLKKTIGFGVTTDPASAEKLIQYINLKLAALGLPNPVGARPSELNDIAAPFLAHQQETDRLLSNYLCPADRRLQNFLNGYFRDTGVQVRLPRSTFLLDRHGLARTLSLPLDQDEYLSETISSYRLRQGILHNPQKDRRTTKGIFHIAEGGLPIPDDKLSVPKSVAAQLLRRAFEPPPELLELPFTSTQEDRAACFVSLLLRPIVCPAVPNFTEERTMEIRFFAPGTLVSNLDFVESIFGNGGDPYLPENDAGLDVTHWTGHTGCVILATHLAGLTKKELGLPPWDKATPRQQRDGMAWKEEAELYNNGEAFKLACRDAHGVMITVIADNYFGYCKKEVKTQISFSANLLGLCEEEHAGGALVYPSYDLGEEFSGHLHVKRMDHSFEEVVRLYGEVMDVHPEGYAVDRNYPDIVYVSEHVHFDLDKQLVSWPQQDRTQTLKLLPGKTYVRPSGYRVHMEKPPGESAWRLVGTVAEPTLCHKPCTVSGGGKSEISKPITDAILQGPVFVADFKKDFDQVAKLLKHNYAGRFKDKKKVDNRSVMSPERSLGSVIKLLTPASREYTVEYNDWLKSIPQYIKELVFVVKRFYKPDWGDHWRDMFSVDTVNGNPGNQLKFHNRRVIAYYMRVGYEADGSWRTFGLRSDFHPSSKWALEDDITASVVVPAGRLRNLNPEYENAAVKFVTNCEYRLFQRPDEAVHRGYDKQAEADIAAPNNFLSNYEPLTQPAAVELIEDAIGFDRYTAPMQQLIREAATNERPQYFVSSAHPRVVEGRPSKNPRYLQTRPDLLNARDGYLAQMATRLHRRLPLHDPLYTPVNAVLPGRRNNPPDAAANIRSLAVYNPIHYMELPELFMEFICSMTGKSPSTTGAGSEGAMTKGPFNALLPIIDVNNALVSYLLTGHHGFVTAAGSLGPEARIDHDISLLIPEIWCRMSVQERTPSFLIENGYLEKCRDLSHQGRKVLASRLGYRITRRFVRTFFGRVFNHPHQVLTEPMLHPELQSMEIFVEGMDNIVETQKRVAQSYFDDGGIEQACPPLKALLHVMLHGQFEGKGLDHPGLRGLFTREHLLGSSWYAERLAAKQQADLHLWQRHWAYLEEFQNKPSHTREAERLGIKERFLQVRRMVRATLAPEYLESLRGSIGLHPLGPVPVRLERKARRVTNPDRIPPVPEAV